MDHLDRKAHGAVTQTVLVRLLQEGISERRLFGGILRRHAGDLNKMFMTAATQRHISRRLMCRCIPNCIFQISDLGIPIIWNMESVIWNL